MPPKIYACIKIAGMVVVAMTVCWVAGCAKKSEREAVPEIPDTLSVTSDTLSKTHDTLSETPYTLSETHDTLLITPDTLSDIPNTLTDKRDWKTYRTVKMPDGKTWMAENLNYRTPDSSWCYYDDTSGCNKYGRLYAWNAAMMACPAGWHLPSRQEWDGLSRAVGGIRKSNGDGHIYWETVGKKLKAKSGWDNSFFDGKGDLRNSYYDGKDGNGNDKYGFSALPGGCYANAFGHSLLFGRNAYWWAAAEFNGYNAYTRNMYFDNDNIGEEFYGKGDGRSVRCVIDDKNSRQTPVPKTPDAQTKKSRLEPVSVTYNTLTDTRDGKTYKTVKIGNQTWMAQNLNYLTDSSWCYNNDDSYCKKYGRLYSWNAAMTACPKGWHLPADQEWNYLGQAVGCEREPAIVDITDGDGTYEVTNSVVWSGAGIKLKTKSGWDDYGDYGSESGNRGNYYGFSALPGGSRSYGSFHEVGYSGCWWTANAIDDEMAYYRYMGQAPSAALGHACYSKSDGVSVRCVADRRTAR